MTETTTTEVPAIDTAPGNTSSGRAIRHQVRHLAAEVLRAVEGRKGLTQDQQVERIIRGLTAAETMVAELTTLKTLLANRDWEKFQADKPAAPESDGEGGGGFIGFLVVGPADGDNDGDDDIDPDAL